MLEIECSRKSKYVFIAYKEGRIGSFFFLLHTLFRMNFRKFINKKQPKVSPIFFFCKISNKKERYHKITHYIIVI